MNPPRPTYKAFLSYSHSDTEHGDWFHTRLDRYRIDRELVGRSTVNGTIPSTLHPVFRDRTDSAAGHSLKETIKAALVDSEWLIVLCSPNAAESPYVNEEIRIFKVLGRANRIIPVILSGDPKDPQKPCFPPALTHAVDDEGRITTVREEPIAADARDEGDGRNIALLKVIAGMLGLRLDEIIQRERRRQRRETQKWATIAASMLVLALAVGAMGFLAWQEAEKNARLLNANEQFLGVMLRRVSALVDRAVASSRERGVPVRETMGFLDEAAGFVNDMTSLGKTMTRLGRPSNDLLHQKALMLLAHAQSYADIGDTDKRIAVSREAVALLDDISDTKGRVAFDRVRAHARLGLALQAANRRDEAMGRYSAALALIDALASSGHVTAEERPWLDVELARVLRRQGQIYWTSGKRPAAQEAHRHSRALLESVIASSPDNSVALEELATVLEDVLGQYWPQYSVEQIETWAAEIERIRTKLLDTAPDSARRRKALAITYLSVGDVHIRHKRPDQALKIYNKGRELVLSRLTQDPGNSSLLSDAAWFAIKIGDANCLNAFDLVECERAYRESTEHFERLVKLDPTNVSLRFRWSIAHRGVGIALREQGRNEDALVAYRRNVEILEGILKEGQRADAKRDLALIHGRMGGALEALTRFEDALQMYRTGLRLRMELHADDRGNALWLADVARAHNTISNLQMRLNRYEEAIETLGEELSFRKLIAVAAPHNRDNSEAIARISDQIARLHIATANRAQGLEILRDVLGFVEGVRKAPSDVAVWVDTERRVTASMAELGRNESDPHFP